MANPKDTDAAMIVPVEELPEFNTDDYASEAEMLAALRARMGDEQFARFMDQSNGDGITVTAPQDRSK